MLPPTDIFLRMAWAAGRQHIQTDFYEITVYFCSFTFVKNVMYRATYLPSLLAYFSRKTVNRRMTGLSMILTSYTCKKN